MLNLKSLVLLCRWSAPLLALVLALICAGCASGPAPLTVEMPLHLEEHLDAATIVGSEVPEDIPQAVEWRFDQPQPDWKPAKPIPAQIEAVKPVRADDALRLPLTTRNRIIDRPRLVGAIYVTLPDWDLEDWGYVEIRARTRDPMDSVGLGFNYTDEDPAPGGGLGGGRGRGPFLHRRPSGSPCDRRHGPDVPAVSRPKGARLGGPVDAPGNLV